MEFLVAVDENFAIGRKGQLLFRVSEDMAFFRRITTGHTVVMGRRTFESLPGRKPLPERTNVVLTSNIAYVVPEAIVVHDLAELAAFLKDKENEKVFLIGGAKLYETLLPYCTGGFVTCLGAAAEHPDRYFPQVMEDPDWRCENLVYESTTSTIPFRIYYFKNLAVRNLEEGT